MNHQEEDLPGMHQKDEPLNSVPRDQDGGALSARLRVGAIV